VTPPAASRSVPDGGALAAKATRVLLVDDDASALETLPAVLATLDLQVEIAASLEEAKAALGRSAPDLVITDLRLRGRTDSDGLELISWTRDRHPGTRIALMTAFGSSEVRTEALRRGAADYWEKSIPIADLLRRVRALCGG